MPATYYSKFIQRGEFNRASLDFSFNEIAVPVYLNYLPL